MLLFPHLASPQAIPLRRNAPITSARALKQNGQAMPGRSKAHNRCSQATSKPSAAALACPQASPDRRSRRRARCPSEMPAKPIAVPGTKPFGLAMNLLRSSKVQVPPLDFIAAEKLKPPLPSPFFSLTVPKRFGPTRFGPPFSKVWQAAHFLAAAVPFSTDAVCSSFSIGSDGAAAARRRHPWFLPSLRSRSPASPAAWA